MSFETWLIFSTTWTVALIGVGANSIICMAAGAANGVRVGVWAALGVTIASVIHALIAAFGFSAILLALPVAETWLKWGAAVYLIGLGLCQWYSSSTNFSVRRLHRDTKPALFRRGLVVSLSNPQAILYYAVFFLPYLDSTRNIFVQLLVIVPTATTLVFVAYLGYVLTGSAFQGSLATKNRQNLVNRISALVLMLIGSFFAARNIIP